MTLKNNRAPLLCCFQLCAWFHCHMWIQTGVRVRKRLSWVLTSVTLTFDLWPWPFAWTSLLTMVITPENFMMIRWWEHGEKGVTDGQTDGRTDRQTDRQTENTICRAAWSQLKIIKENQPRLRNIKEMQGHYETDILLKQSVEIKNTLKLWKDKFSCYTMLLSCNLCNLYCWKQTALFGEFELNICDHHNVTWG